MTDVTSLGPAWTAIFDDAALLAPDAMITTTSLEQHQSRRTAHADLVGMLVVRDTDLPLLRGVTHPLRIVLSQGAGAVAGPLALAARLGLDVSAIQVALRDVDDLAGNVRRLIAAVDAARDDGGLGDELAVHVEVPTDLPGGLSHNWARAADEVAAEEWSLHFRTHTPGLSPATPGQIAAWIDAALDRETPFSFAAHLGFSTPGETGVANLLLATRRAFDGSPRSEVSAILAGHDREAVWAEVRSEEFLPAARRWLRSVQVPDLAATASELQVLHSHG